MSAADGHEPDMIARDGGAMGAGERLIVVDDDASVRGAIADYLNARGYRCETAGGGGELDALLARAPAALVILDVMMPGEDGIAICRRLAPRGVRILMLSALGDAGDRIVGLELGADDYLAKPFEPRELLARIRSILRRGHGAAAGAGDGYLFAGWHYRADERVLRDPGGVPVALTAGDHVLLRTFLERAGRLLSRDQILDMTRGAGADACDRSVDLAVSRLRRKLGTAGSEMIETLRGGGYRFVPPVIRG